MSEDKSEYKVGYGNPPKETQFKKGQSGNRKGRPKGGKNLDQILKKEMSTKVTIKEGGKSKKITKKEALVKRLFKDAVDGKPAAQRQLFALMQFAEASTEAALPSAVLTQTEQALFAEFVEWLEASK